MRISDTLFDVFFEGFLSSERASATPKIGERDVSLSHLSDFSLVALFQRIGRGAATPKIAALVFLSAALEEPIKPPVQVNYTKLLINGHFVDAASGRTFPTLDPRTAEVIAHIAEADAEDVDRVVAAARKAFDEGPWPRMLVYERSRILYRFADLIEKHNDEIAALETWSNEQELLRRSK